MTTPNQRGDAAHAGDSPPVTIILTVINEEPHLAQAINAALNSNYRGDVEVVIAVGPSRDRTMEIAQEIAARDHRVRVIENPSGRTPSGLNAALKESRHEIVVRIDGHSEIDRYYISTAVETIRQTDAVNVGGIMAAEGTTPFESAVARAMRSPIGVDTQN